MPAQRGERPWKRGPSSEPIALHGDLEWGLGGSQEDWGRGGEGGKEMVGTWKDTSGGEGGQLGQVLPIG